MSLTEEGYLPRVIDDQLTAKLRTYGAVCVEGPRWCGKTWASLNQAESVTYIGDPKGNFQNRRLAQMDPGLVLEGARPHLVDEWQEVPGIWDAVKFAVDRSRAKGSFLLTGSSTPHRKGVMHSGVGRIGMLAMRPMSLYESGDSSGVVSLRQLFRSPVPAKSTGEVGLRRLAELVVRGGWPANLGASLESAAELTRGYLSLTVEDDASRIDGVQRDPHKLMMLIRSLARNESSLASDATLRRDMLEYDDETLAPDTVTDYVRVLRRLFMLWEQQSYDPNYRSSVRVGKKPKRHLADPSLAAAALGMGVEELIGDLNTFGFLFEGMCVRDLAVYGGAMDATVRHYRDAQNREIDAIVELQNGDWGAFEVKLGANQIDDAAAHLVAMRSLMERDGKARPPKILVVVCGMSSAAYTRPDGVMVVPPTALAP